MARNENEPASASTTFEKLSRIMAMKIFSATNVTDSSKIRKKSAAHGEPGDWQTVK